MEKCLLDLLESEKDCVCRINRSEDRIGLLKSEIGRIKQACSLDEWMARDIVALERRIAQEENEEVANKVCLSNIRREIMKQTSLIENALEGKLEDEESPETTNEESARIFCDAIKSLASKPENLDNLRSYLSSHFDKWLSKYGSSPENISCELREFADMEI